MAFAAAATAEIRARIEPRIIDELETARLILRTTGTAVQTLDLAPLADDFEVLGTQTASQYQSTNGVVEAWVEYQITLRPTRAGQLTVPAVEVGGERSTPLSLEVRGIDPDLRTAIDRMVFFELEVTRNPVYVRSETVLIRRLFYSSATQIYSDLPGPPELPDALVLPIGETRSGTIERDGERYGVIEQRFALFPEHSGTLTIPPISLTSSVRLQVDGRIRRTGARVTSRALPIEVLPIPPEYPAEAPWLPATAVTITDRWSHGRARLGVGEPLERTVAVTVAGNLAAAITPPDDDLPDKYFRQYPEPAVLTDDRSGLSVVGTRTIEYSIIPTAPGTVDLPPLAVTWWDVEQRATRTARAEGRAVLIEGASGPMSTPGDTPADAATRPGEAQPGPAAEPEPLAHGPGPALPSARTLWMAAGALILLLALLLGTWFGRAWLRTHRLNLKAALAPWLERSGLAGETHGLARAWRLRVLRRELAAACRDGEPARIHGALVRYLSVWYRVTPLDALQRFRDAGFGALLDGLQAARFGRDQAEQPAPAAILAALGGLDPARPAAADPLPALYPRAHRARR